MEMVVEGKYTRTVTLFGGGGGGLACDLEKDG
jgi:hypothetical protein